jgi:HlyD family secretion protein
MIEVTLMAAKGVGTSWIPRDLIASENGFTSSTQLDKEPQEAFHDRPLRNDFPELRPSRSWLKRPGLWATFAILICTGLVFLYWRHAQATPPVNCETANADRGSITIKVTATGNLSALLTTQVGSQVSGRVQQLFVDYNSAVKKGQPIAKLDPLLFAAAVQQARAVYLAAQSNLQKDRVQEANLKVAYDRANRLKTELVIAQSDFDTAHTNYNIAQAQVNADESSLESARAALDQAQANLGFTTILSPINGVVISRSVDVGQTVAASFQAPTLFVIAQDLQRMQVDTNVSEADVGRLSPGMQATFTVDGYPGRPFAGTLRQIRNASQTVQNVVTYDAVINVENPKLLLKPGMTANVTFVVAKKDNVLRIRNAALRFRPDPQLLQKLGVNDGTVSASPEDRIVWVLRAGKPIGVPIATGISDGTWTELIHGQIQPGDALITDMKANPRPGLF